MTESLIHKKLKKFATEMLRRKGFETFEEYSVIVNNQRYIVDVVGIKKGEKIAVECGNTTHSKIKTLRTIFDDVLVFNRDHIVIFYEEKLIEAKAKKIKKEDNPLRLKVTFESREDYIRRIKNMPSHLFDPARAGEFYDKFVGKKNEEELRERTDLKTRA